MKLHEYQAKQLFASAGIAVQNGAVASNPEEARDIYTRMKTDLCIDGDFACNVKVQIHAGGRGKAGGVLVARSADEAAQLTEQLIGKRMVTHQTGAEGLPVDKVLLDERVAPKQELYLALTIDRSNSGIMLLACRSGGMDIEAVAEKDPTAIVRESVDIDEGPSAEAKDRIAETLRLQGDQVEQCHVLVDTIWQLFIEKDASLIEINPLVITEEELLLALDAKIDIDDNALYRQVELSALRDPAQEDPMEYKADQMGLSFVGLDGNIGCLVNGAGLAMATNDIIKLSGGEPSNFLDVGGGAKVEQITNAFSIILSDPKVKAVLVNIFGGIMRCDWIAEGLLQATRSLEVKVPIVIRLQGTNVDKGRALLRDAEALNLISVDELGEAARKVVELAESSGS